MKTLLITGATGFIGSHLAEQFVASGDFEVSVLVRQGSSLQHLEGLSLTVAWGDILDPGSLAKALVGQQVVVHNAGLARDWGPRRAFDAVNVAGTKNVLRACQAARVPRILMTGTNSVYGEEDSDEVKTEDSPLRPYHRYFLGKLFPSGMNHYRESKTEAVVWAQHYAHDQGLNLTILEPVWVFGPRELHTGFYEYLKSVQDGTPLVPGRRDNQFALIYVKDLARAYLRAATQELPGVQRFLIASETSITLREFHERLCTAAGLTAPPLMPRWVVEIAGLVLEAVWTVFRRPHAPVLTRGRAALFCDQIRFSGHKARTVLGFREAYTLDQALKETVAWYHDHKLLKEAPHGRH